MMAYLVSLSIITIIESYLSFITGSTNRGSFTTKSIITSFHGVSGTLALSCRLVLLVTYTFFDILFY